MRSKVEDAARVLGYRPNLLARSLMTRRTELIGLVSNNFDNPAHMEVFDLFTRRLQVHGLRPIIVNLTGGLAESGALEVLRQYSVDGVIVASSPLHRDFEAAYEKSPMPVVQAFGRPSRNSSIGSVSADNVQGGSIAAELLLARGYRNVAFLGGPKSATSTSDRLKGLRSRLLKNGIRPVVELYGTAFSHAVGMKLMSQLIDRGDEIDSVFCGDDIIAMGAIDACRMLGISVPGDIGIVGFDDMPMAAWSGYELTTVRQPIGEIIVAAVEMILSIIEAPGSAAPRRLFKCEPVVRKTLGHG
jgi:DNA-binding LacI/PurR family transcriptional regulator